MIEFSIHMPSFLAGVGVGVAGLLILAVLIVVFDR